MFIASKCMQSNALLRFLCDICPIITVDVISRGILSNLETSLSNSGHQTEAIFTDITVTLDVSVCK